MFLEVNAYFQGKQLLEFLFLPSFDIKINSLKKEFAPVGANSFF